MAARAAGITAVAGGAGNRPDIRARRNVHLGRRRPRFVPARDRPCARRRDAVRSARRGHFSVFCPGTPATPRGGRHGLLPAAALRYRAGLAQGHGR